MRRRRVCVHGERFKLLYATVRAELAGTCPWSFSTSALLGRLQRSGSLRPAHAVVKHLAIFIALLEAGRVYDMEEAVADDEHALRFRGAATLLQEPRFQATVRKMSTRLNWMQMPFGDL